MKKQVFLDGNPPNVDDFGVEIVAEFVDGTLVGGGWANMAPASFARYGRGLGLGVGQKYSKQADGRWLKTGG